MKFFRKALLMTLSVLTLCALALFAAACGGGDDAGTNGDPQTVGYTVEVYLAENDGYTLSAEHSSSGTGEVGKSLTLPVPQIAGYVYDAANEGNVTTLTLSENAAENVFRFYYDAETAGALVYNANAPRGTSARGSMESTAVDENGQATVAENGFSITGYRFAGWSYTANGKAEVQPGDTVTTSEPVTLYAVWDRGYVDRFGGTDFIYLPSGESGKVLLERGGAELAWSDLNEDGGFAFTLPDESKLEGKVFTDDSYTFAYAHEDLAGTYIFHTSYYNFDSADGSTAPDPETTLKLDKFGSAVYTHKNGNATVAETGYITAYSLGDRPEYIFVIAEGANAGGGFIFRLGTYGADRTPVYTTTNGEAGRYTVADTPDDQIFYLGYFDLQLDGYGGLTLQHTDYIGEWVGNYWVEGQSAFGEDYYIYMLRLRIQDDPKGYLSQLGSYTADNGIIELSVYTTPLSEDSSVYVEPKKEAGTYRNADGATLKLDGFKTFANSATYTVDGTVHYGSYETIWAQTDLKLTILMHETDLSGTYLGRDYTFELVLTPRTDSYNDLEFLPTFSVVTEAASGTVYRLFDSIGFENTLLTISMERYDGVTGARKASLGTVNLRGVYTPLADGYVTWGALGYAGFGSFTRTELKAGADAADVPKSMIFETGSTVDSNYFLYDIYYVYSAVYEENGADTEVKNYTELTDEEGSDAKIWYVNLPATGLVAGALYFDTDGSVLSGAFSIQDMYMGHVGTFTYTALNGTQQTVQYLYFDVQYGANGPALFTELVELESPAIAVDRTGNADVSTVRLLLRGGEGLYCESGNFDSGATIRGTIVSGGKTSLGADILVLRDSEGNEVLRFVMGSMLFEEPGFLPEQITIYHLYNADADKTYTAADGSKLTLDGYQRGSYTADGNTVTGSYTLSADGKIAYLTAGGRRYAFDISVQGGFEPVDGINATYAMNVNGDWWDVTFDGHGNATARRGRDEVRGIYAVQDDGSVLLFINIVEGVNSYRIRLFSFEGHGEAHIYDDNLAGAFIGEDWTVLYLDGYDSGTYYFPDGFGSIGVTFSILDAEIGYVNLRMTSFVKENVILNFEDKTMSYPEYADRDYIYYGEDLSGLIVRASGEIEMDHTSGYYILADGVYRAYLLSNLTGDYEPVDLGSRPKEGTWTVEGMTYYEWHAGQTVTLTGTVEVDYESTQTSKEATLTFPLTGESDMQSAGRLVYDGETYSVDLINSFDIGTGRQGLAVVDRTNWTYSPITEYQYNGNGAGTFMVKIAATTVTLTDIFEQEAGNTSTLTEYRVGFGPIEIASSKLSGDIYVGGGENLKFTDEDIEATFYYNSEEGRRYNIIFTADDVTYSMQYSKGNANEYSLYLLGTYEKLSAGDYSVGVIRYFYSNEAYDHTTDTKGDFCDFILYDKDGHAIVAMSKAIDDGGTSAWYVDLGTYDPATETGYPEFIYLVDFTEDLKGATVKQYDFLQGIYQGSVAVNFCLEDGEIKDIVTIYFDEEFHTVASYTYDEASKSYTLTLSDGRQFLLEFSYGKDGQPERLPDGSLDITLTLLTESAGA